MEFIIAYGIIFFILLLVSRYRIVVKKIVNMIETRISSDLRNFPVTIEYGIMH
ncbi:MAG: hypothetical protein ACI8RD_008210 [Bacillariaceae sp.]|jgi:hypothetical protein